MALTRLPWASGLLAVTLAFSPQAFALDTPLSDTAIREAYFMGQRHDETFAKFLDKYYKHLAPPKSGPYISSVAMLTPFAQAVLSSNQHIGSYSAQQAEIDHRNQREIVYCAVEIQLTGPYPPFIPDPPWISWGSQPNLVLRPWNFWQDFQVHFLDGPQELRPLISSGHPNYLCSDGGCILTGATLEYEFSGVISNR